MIEVVAPGLLTTVQDGGRPNLGHLGVPPGGACDPWGLAVANLLLGNPPDAPALELTITGPELRVPEATTVGVGGADLGGTCLPDGRRLRPGGSYRIPAGSVIRFPGIPAEGTTWPGARSYVAVPGGFEVPRVLGSGSTCLVAGFGGHEGRPLRVGDRLAPVDRAAHAPERHWPGDAGGRAEGVAHVRVLPGPEGDDPDMAAALADLCARSWTVSPTTDRMGIRLAGASLPPPRVRERLSHGVTWGTVQLPPDGMPIVLLADHQPTGGYPVIAVAISADRPVLGQLRPGARLRVTATTLQDAVAAMRQRDEELRRARDVLREAARWDELWRAAGG